MTAGAATQERALQIVELSVHSCPGLFSSRDGELRFSYCSRKSGLAAEELLLEHVVSIGILEPLGGDFGCRLRILHCKSTFERLRRIEACARQRAVNHDAERPSGAEVQLTVRTVTFAT